MRILVVESELVDVPLRGAFQTSHGVRSVQRSVIVRVRSDAGTEGVGNVDPTPGYTEATAEEIHRVILERLGPALAGADPGNLRAALRRMDRVAPAAREAHAAVEMALVDLSGKALGIPAHRLLGGAVRTSLHLNGWIGIVDPERAAAMARDLWTRGYRSAKVKAGGGVEADRDRVAAVRAAVPDLEIRVDANEGYDVESAIRLARALGPYGVALLEQPIPRKDLEGLATIRRAIDIPLMADEAVVGPETLAALIRLEAADIVKVKVMKQGGLLRCLQAVEMAAGAGIRCVLGHGFGLTISTLAELHVAATSDDVLDGVECVGPTKLAGDVVSEPLRLEAGMVAVPSAPGLGALLDPAALGRYRVTAGS